MTKKTKTVSLHVPASALSGGSVNELDEDDELEEGEKDFLATLTEIEGADSIRWQLWRLRTIGDPNRPGFVAELGSHEMRLPEVQTRFGAGKYKVRGINAQGQYVGGKTFEIARDPDAAKAPVMVNQSGDVLGLVQSMNEREEKRAEKRDQMLALAIPAAIAALPALIAAMKGGSSTDPIVMLGALKQLQPAAPDHSALLLKLIEMAGGKDSPDEPAWMGLLKQAATDLLPAISAKINSTPSPTPTPTPIAATSQPTPQPVALAPTQEANPMLKLLNWARETLAYLLRQAQKDSDPELYAEWLIDNVPDDVDLMQFVGYLNQENWFDVLQQFNAQVATFKPWFEEFRAALLKAVKEIQDEARANAQDSEPKPDGAGEPNE